MGLFGRGKRMCLACSEKVGAMRAGLEIGGSGWLCNRAAVSAYIATAFLIIRMNWAAV